MANDYKLWVRNETNDGWINVLTDTNVKISSDGASSGQFASNVLDEVLLELKDLAGGGAPGYAGTPIHIINTDDVSSSTDDAGSFSTRGGMAIAKSVWIGTTLDVAGTSTFNDDVTFVGANLILDQNLTGVVNVTGVGTGNLTGFIGATLTGDISVVNVTATGDIAGVNATLSGLTTTDTLLVSSSIDGNLVPTNDGTQFLGSPTNKWNTVYVGTISADTVNSTAFTGVFTGTLNGNVVGNVSGNVVGNLDGDLIGSPTVTVTSNQGSTSPTTGALVVEGGVGIAENLHVGGILTAAGIDIGFDAFGDSIIPDTTNAYDLGASDKVWANIYATTFFGGFEGDITGDLTGNLLGTENTTQGNFTVGQNLTVTGDLNVGGSITYPSLSSELMFVTSINDATDKDTGALIVTQGGLGVEKNVHSGGTITSNTSLVSDALTSQTLDTNLVVTANGTGVVEIADTFQVSDQTGNTVDIDVATDIAGILTVSNITGSTDKDTGALVVEGGVGIEQNLNVGGNFVATGSVGSNAGNVWAYKGDSTPVSIDAWSDNGGSSYSEALLYANEGSFTKIEAIYSDGSTYDHRVEMKANAITSSFSMGNQWDEYYLEFAPSIGDVNATYRFDTANPKTTGKIVTFAHDGTEMFYINGTDTVSVAPVIITDTTQSIDKDTGALVVEGGVGIEKDLFVGGNVYSNTLTATTFIGNLNGDVTGSLIGDSVEADTITANLGIIGDLTKTEQILITGQDPLNHNGSGNNADLEPSPLHAFGDGQVYITGGEPGRETGASMSITGNIFMGGDLYLDSSGRWLDDELDARPVENGFVDRAESLLSFDDITQELTIEPNTGGGYTHFHYYAAGQRYVVEAPVSVAIPATEGIHYFYFNNGVLETSTTFTPAIITDYAFVAAVYWSTIGNHSLTLAEERHGNVMSNETHSYLHNTRGTVLAGGGALGVNTDLDGSDISHAQVTSTNITMYDEDIRHDFTDGSPQQLSPYVDIPVWHRHNAGWHRKDADGTGVPFCYGGYTVGETVTVDGGTTPATLTITGTDAALGTVTTFAVTDGGTGYTNGVGVTTTGGNGYGFTVDITETVVDGILTDAEVILNSGGGPGGNPRYNVDLGGGLWSFNEVPDGQYTVVHIVAINDVNEPVIAIMGQSIYTTLNDAYQGGSDEAGNLEFGQLASLSAEWVFLGTLVAEVSSAYTNTYGVRLRADVEGNDYIDLRGAKLSPSGGTTADDHAGLTNIQGGAFGAHYHSNQSIDTDDTPRFHGINIDWQTATDTLLLTSGQRFLVNNTVSTLLLPPVPDDGISIHLSDVDNSWGATPVTLDSNGTKIDGVVQNMTLNVPGASLELVYTGASQGWKII